MNLLALLVSSPIGKAGGLIFSMLVMASLSLAIVGRARPLFNISELRSRVRAWWVMAAFFFAAIVVNRVATILFFGFMSFWVLKEYVTILDTRRSDHRALLWAFLCIPIQYYWVTIGWYGMFIIFIPVYVFLFIPVRLVLTEDTKGFLASTASIHWGLMAFVFGLSHLAFLSTMPMVAGLEVGGPTLLLFLVIVTEMNDVFQFIWENRSAAGKSCPG